MKVKLQLLIDIDMSFMVEKGIRGEIWHAIYQYVGATIKDWNNFDKNI